MYWSRGTSLSDPLLLLPSGCISSAHLHSLGSKWSCNHCIVGHNTPSLLPSLTVVLSSLRSSDTLKGKTTNMLKMILPITSNHRLIKWGRNSSSCLFYITWFWGNWECVWYIKWYYNSFKIFLCFKLPQIPWLKLLRYQLLLTKFGRCSPYSTGYYQKKGTVTRSPWEWSSISLVVFVQLKKMVEKFTLFVKKK